MILPRSSFVASVDEYWPFCEGTYTDYWCQGIEQEVVLYDTSPDYAYYRDGPDWAIKYQHRVCGLAW